MVTAIIVAAGRGVRMGLPVKKQYLPLGDRPLLCRTLSAFSRHPEVSSLVLVAPEEDFPFLREQVLPFVSPQKPLALAPGGTERQDSVFSGLSMAPESCDIVLVHDGVRPFVEQSLISACISEARAHGAAIAAIAASDTVKQGDEDGFVEKTLDRGRLWLTQTPQAFRLSLLLAAHREAREKGVRATDDAALAEAMGLRVKIVPGSRANLKITTVEDLGLARAWLLHQEKG
ncbi:MAG: 2-C-methyl-D-erythritol 4-phosphate cytidylyltransferase [Thermodesulfobacteriota bacterium]